MCFLDLRISTDMTLLVHSSLSKIDRICGGPLTLTQVLLDLLSLGRTHVMLSETAANSHHQYWQNTPILSEWLAIIPQSIPSDQYNITATCNMGKVAETLFHRSDILRSQYPQFSMIATNQLYDCTANGYVLLLGIPHKKNSSLYLVDNCFQKNDTINKFCQFIGFTFDYTHYFSKPTLKYFFSVIKQSDYDQEITELICVQLNIVLCYCHRIHKILHKKIRQKLEIPIVKDLHEPFVTMSVKNLSKQVDLERMKSQIQESIIASKAQQSDVVISSDKNPECLSNLKMYFILLRSFDAKTNVFEDLVSLLPKLKKMGINTLWLSPPQPQTAVGPPMFALNDHGYWPSHHGKVDPILGGEVALEHLIQEAHLQGIEIAIDAVLNHFGYTDQVVLNDKEISTWDPNYFVIISNIQSTYNRHEELNQKIESSSNTAEILEYREELSQYPLFDLPTLRKDNTEIRTYLLDSYKKFVDMGVTTFRIDAAKHMPAEFLVDFSNQLNRYSLMRLGCSIKLIWEVYIATSQSLSAFIEGTLRNLEDPTNTFFYDFSMREEFKRIQDPSYQFGWLAGFVQHREQTQQRLDRLIPLVEDHDNGSPIHNPSIAKIIYALTEFYSRNSTFIYHGSEQAGVRVVDRPRINTINESGDIAFLIDRLGNRLLPYRIHKETQTFFHIVEQDLLVSEKRLPDGRSILLAVNKGSAPRVVDLPLQDSYGRNRMSVEKILATLDSEADLDLQFEKIQFRLSPHSFSSIEVHPDHCCI